MDLLLEHLAKTWHIEVLFSIPETFVFFTFSLIFFGHKFHTFWRRLLVLSVIQGFFIDSLVIYIPGYLQGLKMIVSYMILFFIFFREFSKKDRLRIPLFVIVVSTIFEIISSIILLMFVSFEELLNPMNLVIGGWPYFIAFSIGAYIINKKKTNYGQRIFQFIVDNKSIFILSIVLSLQLCAIAGLTSSSFNKKSNIVVLNFLSAISIVLSVLIIYLVINFFSKLKSQVFQMTEEMYIKHINNLFVSIKSQRHDFLNNAQVMIAMLHKQDKEGLQKYLDEYKNELRDLNEIIVINEPAISALIQTKKILADQQNIQFEFHFSSLEKINLGIKIIDIVKILGNLIDNAFDEVLQLPEDQRYVGIVSWIDLKTLCINVSNSLKENISLEQVDQMFEANYTSKQNGHTGLGLAIIKQKVEQLKGEITAIPEDETITFNLRLPLKNNEFKGITS